MAGVNNYYLNNSRGVFVKDSSLAKFKGWEQSVRKADCAQTHIQALN